jgi:protease-4
MRVLAAILTAAVATALLLPGTAQADVLGNTWLRGASSVALNDDATAIFLNPAGLALYGETSGYGSLSTAGGNSEGAAFAFKGGGFGFAWNRQYMWEPYGDSESNGYRLTGKMVDTYTLGLGFGEARKWGLGFDYRWFRQRYGDYAKSGTWDVGFMYRPFNGLSLGFAARNLSEPTLPTSMTGSAGGVRGCECETTTSYVSGIAIRPFGNRLTIMADMSVPRDNGFDDAVYSGGIETEIMNGLVLRASVLDHKIDGERQDDWSVGLWLNGLHFGAGYNSKSFTGATDHISTYEALVTAERMRTVIKPTGQIAEIKIAGQLADVAPGWSFFGEPRSSAQRIVRNIRTAANESGVECIVVRIGDVGRPFLGGPSGLIQDIRDELEWARDVKGKKIVAYFEYFVGTQEYYLATVADQIVLNPISGLEGIGNYVNVQRFTESTGKLGIDWDFMSAGKYKSTFHSIGAGPLTDEQREEVQSLVDANYAVVLSGLTEGRGMSLTEAAGLSDGRMLTAPQALEAGLVDRLGHYEDAKTAARELIGGEIPDDPEKIDVVDVGKWKHKTYDWNYGPVVAVIGAYGSIHTGKGGTDPMSGDQSIGSQTMVKTLRRARKDSRVKAVIFRVDSGGGGGLATDEIRRETKKLAEKKPFIVSMADVAGSGGYGISVEGDRIFAQPPTITGSIGVVAMKPILEELYNKIDATSETFKRGEHSDQWSLMRGMTEEELEMAREVIDWFYEDFLKSVAEGRGMEVDELRELAEGRVYTGTQALEVGLIDELGGLSAAIDYACETIDVEREKAAIVFYRKKSSFCDMMMSQATRTLGLHRFISIDEGGLEDLYQLEMTNDVLDALVE